MIAHELLALKRGLLSQDRLVAGRLAFHARAAILHIHDTWPWATALVDAFVRARALPAPA